MLPIITTKKIHISSKQKEIKVDFTLNIPGDPEYRRMLMSSEIASLYYFYFLILDDSSINLLSGLKKPEVRQHLVGSIYRGQISDVMSKNGLKMISYQSVLENHSTIDYNTTDLTNDYNNDFRSSVTINYQPKSIPITMPYLGAPSPTEGEVQYIDYAWRGMGYAQTIGLVSEAGIPPGQQSGVSGETEEAARWVTAETRELTLGGGPIPYENLNTNELHLVCFIDMDLTTDRPPFAGNDMMSYDLLLNRESQTGRLDVPKNIRSFYISDPSAMEGGSVAAGASRLTPYHGPVHYHEASPNDQYSYVGWMAGNRDNMGPKLELVTFPNYKITSDLKVFENQSPNSGTTLDTSSPGWSNEAILSRSNLRSDMKMNNLIKGYFRMMEDMEDHRSNSSLTSPNIIDYESQRTAYVNYVSTQDTSTDTPIVLGESHHGFAISVNFIDLVKYRSRLGYLLNFHQKSGNEQFVHRCMFESKIKDISFYRYRIVNNPYEINERQSTVYTKYDTSEYGKYIVSSSDKDAQESSNSVLDFKHRLLNSSSEIGAMEEVEIMQMSRQTLPDGGRVIEQSAPYSRQFIVKDYDLFHNVNYGKYSYNVKIILQDGIEKFLNDFHKNNKKLISDYERFLFYAEIPKNTTIEGHYGNYDYVLKKFTDSFKENQENKRIVKEAIIGYRTMKSFLSGMTEQSLEEEIVSLRTRLDLEAGNLQDLREFYNILQEMNNCVKSILSYGIDLSSDRIKTNFASEVENSVGGNLKSIEVISKTNVISEAIAQDTVVADFNPQPGTLPVFNTLDTFRDKIVNISQGPFIMPTQFLTLHTFDYDSDDSASVTTAKDVPSLDFEIKKGKYRKKKKPEKNKSQSKILIRLIDYKTLNNIKNTNINMKIDYLIKKQNSSDKESSLGETDKPDSYFPFATQRYFGGITLGLSGGTVNNFSGKVNYLEHLLDYANPGLSDEIKKEICDSVYKEDDRDFFLNEIERRYEDLVNLRSLLGIFYDYVHNNLRIRKNLSISKRYNRTFEQVFKGDNLPQQQRRLKKADVFMDHGRHMTLISPLSGPIQVDVSKLRISSKGYSMNSGVDTDKKRVICVKMESYSKDQAPAVNNVAFLEV